MPTSMVLRFRDLVAETIQEHRELIEQHGYVWWGWWNKPDEKIPRNTFASFQEIIKGTGLLCVYLVDSGRKLLYKAKLVDIKVSETEDVIACPEPEKTPGYYKAQKYKAWFRFTEIRDVSSGKIEKWTYDEVPDFLDDPTSTKFQDKRVFDVQEMLNRRHRTIYFIKPYDSRQHKHYLIALEPPVEFRKDFVTTPILRDSTYICHLSDLHFSDKHHGFALKPDRAHSSLLSLLDSDLKRYRKAPAAVIISGDFTWQGRWEEYELAYDFINKFQGAAGLRPEHFVFVPGNHDIQWSEQTGDDYDRSREVTNPPQKAEENYRKFFEKIFGFSPNEFFSMGRRYILENYVVLDIIGLNSCRLEQKPFAGYGYVGIEQVNKAAEAMLWQHGRHRVRYRVLVFHHHVIPVTPVEEITSYDRNYSLTLDAQQLTYKALELAVDLITHGHMHQPFASSFSRPAKGSKFSPSRSLAIHGAGSVGAKREHLGAIGKNSYSVYELDKEGIITVRIRSSSESV